MSLGVGWGQLGIWGIEWKGVCLPNACLAALPGRVSYILPLPRCHGNMAARARGTEVAKFIPIRLIQCLEPWSLYSAFGRSWTKPYMPLNSSLSGLLAPASGFSLTWQRSGNTSHPHPLHQNSVFLQCKNQESGRNGNKSLLTWAKLSYINFPFGQLEEK